MCIVSYTKNFIFFHIPKCGGTSMSNLIGDLRSFQTLFTHTHFTYLETKKICEENGMLDWFNNARKFTIVRNPFNRMTSLYKYIQEQPTHYLNNRILNYDFTQFCYFVKNIGDEGIKTQFEHLENEFGEIDESIEIFKLEEINNNLSELSDIIGRIITEFPLTNSSNYFFQTSMESNLLIVDLYKKDLERFYSEIL